MDNNALIFIIVSVTMTLVSLVLDRKKTVMGVKKGWKMFQNIAVPFLITEQLIHRALP